ncbi:acyltransferase family protein [Clostridium saudiense]|uniref:acyltransferase family protein n=1 Tax=Clostridium saudiense TaxID=1414720 RepID=UPI0018AB79DE|nr:acyltransferase family protein [Clostridium saudiense]
MEQKNNYLINKEVGIEERERIKYLDVLRGFLILTVVFGHIIDENDTLSIIIYTIHMPAFFIISGMLNNINNKTKTLKYMGKRLKSLIIPYIIFSLMTIFIHIFINKGITGDIKSEILSVIIGRGVGAVWFLMALFIAESIYLLLNRIINNKVINIIIITLLFIFGINGNNVYNSFYLFGIYRALIALGFYSIGIYISNYLRIIDINNILIILILLIILFLGIKNGRVDLWGLKFNNKILYVLNSLIGSIALIYLFKNIFNNIKFLSYLGKNTLIIMGTHQILIKIIEVFTKYERYNMSISFVIFLINILLEIPIIYLINNYLPWILGRSSRKETLKLS